MEIKRIWNPPNPYLSEHRELLGEAPPAELEVYEDGARSILSSNDGPDIGLRWSVNPYRGCFHACAYCYARPTHEYFGLGAGTDFDRKIFVKTEAPALLERAFRRPSWRGERVVFSGATDCYQPLEASYRLTRGCLEVCLAFRNPVGLITKSSLIRRDAELLSELSAKAAAQVFVSIPFWDEATARAIEPGAPSIRSRFKTLERLAEAGVPVGIGVSPIIPGLNDSDIPLLLQEARRLGARYAFKTLIRLPGSVKAVFLHRLEEALPGKVSKVVGQINAARGGRLNDGRFGRRRSGEGKYWELTERLWELWARRLGFNPREPEPGPTFQRPPKREPGGQLELGLAIS